MVRKSFDNITAYSYIFFAASFSYILSLPLSLSQSLVLEMFFFLIFFFFFIGVLAAVGPRFHLNPWITLNCKREFIFPSSLPAPLRTLPVGEYDVYKHSRRGGRSGGNVSIRWPRPCACIRTFRIKYKFRLTRRNNARGYVPSSPVFFFYDKTVFSTAFRPPKGTAESWYYLNNSSKLLIIFLSDGKYDRPLPVGTQFRFYWIVFDKLSVRYEVNQKSSCV